MNQHKRRIFVFVPLDGPPVVVREPLTSHWTLDIDNAREFHALRGRGLASWVPPVAPGANVFYRQPSTSRSEAREIDFALCAVQTETRLSGRRVWRFTELRDTPLTDAEARPLAGLGLVEQLQGLRHVADARALKLEREG